MMTQISGAVHRWLGWCPRADMRRWNAEAPPDDEAVVPSAGGSFRGRTIHWLGLFRNQAILQTIGTFCAGFFLFAAFGGWTNLNLFILGLLAGLPFSAVIGSWYLRIFNEVLRDGSVVLWNRYDTTMVTLIVVTVAVSVSIPVLVLLGAVPGVDVTMTTAFFGGFVAVLFWGMLIGILKWESGTHRRLQYNGMVLMLEKGDAYASH